MNKELKDVRIMDNFYQSSSFFPMPLTFIGTLNEDGRGTSYGAYSLVFPYYIAGKDFYAMLLECRNTSNTAKGLLRHGKCTINFMTYYKQNFEQHVLMGFPGDPPEEKMKKLTSFHPIDSKNQELNLNEKFPKILFEAIQVMECTWVRKLDGAENDKVEEEYIGPYQNFNGITSKFGAHFILKVDHILLKYEYYNALVNGVNRKTFAPLPTKWGYRDSKFFWCSEYVKPDAIGIPDREVDLSSVRYAANRLQPDVKFTDDVLKMLVKVPRPYLKLDLQGCVNWANENNCKLITKREMRIINDKRSKEKGKSK
jgi:flavin reductase (DIM6/NTAB) family NADH-FMN oxidoreductase RutF